jgi:hypothetical protein
MSLWPAGNAFAQGEEPYAANFIFNLPKQEAASPVDVTFTVFNPSYKTSGGLMWFSSKPFANLHSAVQQDIQKALMAKGFSIRGPFENYDLIPYQDKKKIDLFLSPAIELTVTLQDLKERAENWWQAGADQIQTGNAEISGRIILEIKEITTQELMWIKTIPFKNFSFPYFAKVSIEKYAQIKKSSSGKLYSYDPLFNGMARGLEEQYPEIMNTFYKLLDPEEMTIIKKEARELKSKKGY